MILPLWGDVGSPKETCRVLPSELLGMPGGSSSAGELGAKRAAAELAACVQTGWVFLQGWEDGSGDLSWVS